MPSKDTKKIARQDRFRFRRQDNIGVAAAEQDIDFLQNCFVDTGDLITLQDCNDPRSIIIGRTGSGKTALLKRLQETEERVIEIHPESLALSYISNSTILNFFDHIGVKLDIFFKLLWRHVFVIELVERYVKTQEGSVKKSIKDRIMNIFSEKKNGRLLAYIETWGSSFWKETEYRIKEIKNNLENNLQASVKADFPHIDFDLSSARNLSREERAEILHRGQNVINRVQIRELSEIIEATDEALSDPQKRYFIVIDSLDENWIEDRLRYRLIRALIETVKDFRKIRNAKIIVALRFDLIERVFKQTRDTGFQEEKYESLYLPITWTDNALTKMLDFRINHLIKRRFTKGNVTHRDLLPSKILREPPMKYILKRSMMRPRDVIMFFNFCIKRAIDKPTITPRLLQEAEHEYSKNRLKSLADEWISDYPNLLYFTRILKSRTQLFPVHEITNDDITETCLEFCVTNQNRQDDDPISISARELVEDIRSANSFLQVLLRAFYTTGLIGLKLESYEAVQWSISNDLCDSISEISDKSKISIHPMFWRALGVKSR